MLPTHKTYNNRNFNYEENLINSWYIYWLLYEFHLFHYIVDACLNI